MQAHSGDMTMGHQYLIICSNMWWTVDTPSSARVLCRLLLCHCYVLFSVLEPSTILLGGHTSSSSEGKKSPHPLREAAQDDSEGQARVHSQAGSQNTMK